MTSIVVQVTSNSGILYFIIHTIFRQLFIFSFSKAEKTDPSKLICSNVTGVKQTLLTFNNLIAKQWKVFIKSNYKDFLCPAIFKYQLLPELYLLLSSVLYWLQTTGFENFTANKVRFRFEHCSSIHCGTSLQRKGNISEKLAPKHPQIKSQSWSKQNSVQIEYKYIKLDMISFLVFELA